MLINKYKKKKKMLRDKFCRLGNNNLNSIRTKSYTIA